MKKKSDKGNGVSFSPELGEALSRLKRKEPELDEIVGRETNQKEGKGADDREEDS